MTRQAIYHQLLAWGPDALPKQIELSGRSYRLIQLFKHDFFAATGLYRGPMGPIVLKHYRHRPCFGLPMAWMGRWMADRESHHYQLLDDLEGIPRFISRYQQTGLVHEFISGQNLERKLALSDTFFDELFSLMGQLHRRQMAYVDANKMDNILVSDDGKPYLIDFQISLHWPAACRWRGPRWLLERFQQADLYHLLKHKRRCRPDQMRQNELQLSNRNRWIVLHRLLANPFRKLRRKILAVIKAPE